MSLLNKFSRDMTEISNMARSIAIQYNQSCISATHIFMGILYHRGNMACQIIEDLGFEPMDIYEDLVTQLIPEEGFVYEEGDIMPYLPSTKTLFELASNEMSRTSWVSIDTLHVLLAMLKLKSGDIKDVMAQIGLTYEEVDEHAKLLIEQASSFIKATNSMMDQLSNPNLGDKRQQSDSAPIGKSNKRLDALETYGRNLTALARKGDLDPVIGRKIEIERIWRILGRRKKNNAIIIGESGCGKTSIAEGLANQIANQTAPSKLLMKEIYLLDVPGMVAGSKYRGDFEKRMKDVIEECRDHGDVILFIDEIHTIIGSGGAEGTMDGANILKPALASGDVQVIGATTSTEYQKYFESDTALVRRFQKLNVNSPDRNDTVDILKGIREQYESYHNVKYTDEILELIVDLSDKFIVGQHEPDRSINTMDEVGSKIALIEREDPKVLKVKKQLTMIEALLSDAVVEQDFKKAADLKEQWTALQEKEKEMEKDTQNSSPAISEEDVREVFSLISGVPVESIQSDSGDAKRYLTMADDLNADVINQEEAIDAISKAIKRKKAGVEDSSKPSVMMFAGPSGCGKTFVTKKLAGFLFGCEKKLVFLNGAEYADKTAVNRLTSSNPGYVGYGESTDFEPIRNNPYSILLIDECEKMHPEIWQIFLRIFEEGELTTSNGKLINFKNTIIVLTSNLGSEISKQKSMGFALGSDDDKQVERKNKYMKAIKDYFKPEVFNRLSKIVVFNDLRREDLRTIVKLELKPLIATLKDKGIKLTINQKACDYLIDNSDDKNHELGARPIKRSIEKHLNDDIADIVLEKGDSIKTIRVSLTKEGITIKAS